MCSLINHHAVKAQTKLLSKPGCTEARFKQMDKNLVKMIGLGHGGRNSPLNKAELKTFCRQVLKKKMPKKIFEI